jgi:hypothetical protein
MCSKCFREVEMRKRPEAPAAAAPAAEAAPKVEAVAKPAVEAAAAAAPPSLGAAPSASPAAAAAAVLAAQEPEQPAQPNRGRCFTCSKKVGLLGFECRCGYVFCSGHRHAQDHTCSFDYAAFDRERLAKANPLVAGSKLDKL